jgi:hypothetical protein
MTPREEMDRVLDVLVTASQQFLADQGGFYPHAAAIDSGGDLQLYAGWTGEDHPDPTELMELLRGSLRSLAEAKEVRATGIAVDVRVVPPGSEQQSDAISVALEHAEDDPVSVFLPYRAERGAVQYGELYATPGESKIFLAT